MILQSIYKRRAKVHSEDSPSFEQSSLFSFCRSDNNICFNVYNLEAKSMLKKLDSGQIDIASTFYCLKCM